jgi:hypothetical protein
MKNGPNPDDDDEGSPQKECERCGDDYDATTGGQSIDGANMCDDCCESEANQG